MVISCLRRQVRSGSGLHDMLRCEEGCGKQRKADADIPGSCLVTGTVENAIENRFLAGYDKQEGGIKKQIRNIVEGAFD